MMNILHKILMATLAVATPLLWSCSDGPELGPDASAPLSISLYSGSTDDETTTSRYGEGDPEFYIGKTHLYLFASDDEGITAKYHQSFDAGADYTMRTLHLNLNEDSADIATIFGTGSNRTCYAYIVANLPEDLDKKLDDAGTDITIGTIKNFELNTDFSKETVESFPMDGGDILTLNEDYTLTPKTSSRIALKRAAVRIYINVYVRQELILDGATYNPMADDADIKLNNAVSYSKLDKTVDLSDDNYIEDYTMELDKDSYEGYTHAEPGGTKMPYYKYTTHTPMYSYSSDWTDNPDRNVNATICIPWKKTETVSVDGSSENKTTRTSYKKYYYQIPIPTNLTVTKLNRNTQYGITVYLNVLGSSLKTDYVIPGEDQLNFEITDWTDDGANITSSLDRNHYLVVQDNTFSLYNEDEVDIEYESCDDDVKAYVTEIKYLSTKDNTTYYLYYSSYDSESNTYKEVTGKENFVDTDNLDRATVRASVASMVSKVKYTSTTTDNTTDNTTNDSESDNYYLHFESAVSAIAEKLYRPVEYTIVLVNGSKHGSGRQTITITQYPSKYVEFGDAGNVFVNGYFALIKNSNTIAAGSIANYKYTSNNNGNYNKSSTQTGYYMSYPFVVSDYSATDGTYSSTSADVTKQTWYDGYTNTNVFKQSAVNTSYEYLQGVIQDNLTLNNTIDVHVTAFNSDDNYFTANTGSETKTYYYKIGDSRVDGNFKEFTHPSSENNYVRDQSSLYDYYVYGSKTGSTYYRHVKSWGEDAGKIKKGGITSNYDEIISPLYKVQSPYGALIGRAYYDVAQKRCATYQEAGYPAGRWRMPTLAEIAYIVRLQEANAIDQLFVPWSDVGYWTSNGGIIYVGDSTRETKYTSNVVNPLTGYQSNERAWVRCVYDLWYWGSDPVTPKDVYHPMPTASTSTTTTTTTTTSVKKTKSTNNVKRRR